MQRLTETRALVTTKLTAVARCKHTRRKNNWPKDRDGSGKQVIGVGLPPPFLRGCAAATPGHMFLPFLF